MKKSKVILYRSLYFAAKLFSWRRLMLFAGASLLAASQACRPTQKMCYEIAVPDSTSASTDTIIMNDRDSLYQMIDCYEIPNYPDSVYNEPDNK
ncbi:MAG: hypothetical protein RB294_08835 [Bacteroidales bacterium]|jgi:hypothetical protein|nr:hypothetical protein [Bacteroidales bacterium]HPB02784.1 hypothetical protein [Bacteroidales bacterium]